MKIAVLSDSHDNIWKLRQAIPLLQQADVVIHCGDLCAPFMIRELGNGLGDIPIHVVWGNNDGDPFLISKYAQPFPNIVLHGPLAEIDLEGFSVAVTHYPQIGKALARSGIYDLVCYGHDHTPHDSWVGDCLLFSPGDLMGLNRASTFAFINLENREIERITL